jgi:hypothetical protein
MTTVSALTESYAAQEKAGTSPRESGGLGSPPSPTKDGLRRDRLSYLADMIRELQVMASESQCETLSGILGIAYAEARQQMNIAPV